MGSCQKKCFNLLEAYQNNDDESIINYDCDHMQQRDALAYIVVRPKHICNQYFFSRIESSGGLLNYIMSCLFSEMKYQLEIVFIVTAVASVYCYPSGAPAGACAELAPVGHGVDAQNSGANQVVSPYTVEVSATTVKQGEQITGNTISIYFSQVYSFNFSPFFLGFGSWIKFLGLRFSVDGVWGLCCGAFWVFGVGLSKYK